MNSRRESRSGASAAGLPLSVFTTALCLTLWVTSGSFTLAAADGLGAHPARRLIAGLLLILGAVAALWQRRRLCALMFARPSLIMVVGAVELAIVALDGFVGGPYVAVTLTSIGWAVILAPGRTVWRLVALLEAGYVIGLLLARSPHGVVDQGNLTTVIGQVLGYPFAALSLLALAGLFNRFQNGAALILDGLRRGLPALTPSLSRAIERPGEPLLALPPGSAVRVRLTPAETRIVEGLARGDAPKQLAHEAGLSLATVRTHIRNAKRKTGARTLRALAALVAQSRWPELGDSDD
jgi:DNA-binding CsgD family transcriptional regulator